MSEKTVNTLEFEENCRALIDEIGRTNEAVTITDHGRAVARLVPLSEEGIFVGNASTPKPKSVTLGGMKGYVLRFDDPFAPAADPADWNAIR